MQVTISKEDENFVVTVITLRRVNILDLLQLDDASFEIGGSLGIATAKTVFVTASESKMIELTNALFMLSTNN